MAREKWETVYKGIKIKKHPSRKHGVKPDIYFSARFQFNGKRINSGLGWASDGWTLDRAIVRLTELKEEAKAGGGIETHRVKQVKADEKRKEEDLLEQERKAHEIKENTTLHDFFYQIYYPQIQKEKKQKTYEREESLFRLWLDKNIGKLTFWAVGKGDIESMFYGMVDSGKSVRTAEYAMTTLKQIWREAREGGYAPQMPMVSKTMKKKISQNNNARIRFLSRSEARILLDELFMVSIPLYEKTLISLHCGLRASEIFNLTWSQVDLEHGIFNIIDSKGTDRSVNMTKDVLELMQQKEKGLLNELVFPGREGKPSTQISQKFREIVNRLFNQGVTDRRERVTFHTCRHTCASWMVKQGISLYLVQKVLGHSTIQVTERYSHLAPDQLQLAADAIDRAVGEHREENVLPFKKKA
ncbi:tyrosine-type recombinase/integrase [Desulfobacter curvatus]|uniref:tyrosine-type recombinase/integrase n=1 Tax=Desulfobacter curvatus TaxID=2290 RepID=UPI000362A631|nr:site-specific integrase [Desulfobacter curvatus]